MRRKQSDHERVREVANTYFDEHGEGRTVCPVCNGGDSKEQCLTIYRGDTSFGDTRIALMATCHRASCAVDTVCVSALTHPSVYRKKKATNTYIEHVSLKRSTFNAIQEKYEFEFDDLLFASNARTCWKGVAFPMWDVGGTTRGCIVKKVGEDISGPKSLTYLYDTDYDGMSWYIDRRGATQSDVYVVEDVVSAIALHDLTGATVVSLNGTHLNQVRIDALLRHKWRVVLMLDADATRKAIRYVHRYGPDLIRVVRLTHDIKNMTRENVSKLLEREGLA